MRTPNVAHDSERTAAVRPGRIQRVTRLMALAIRFERLLVEGVVCSYADLARRGRVSRAPDPDHAFASPGSRSPGNDPLLAGSPSRTRSNYAEPRLANRCVIELERTTATMENVDSQTPDTATT